MPEQQERDPFELFDLTWQPRANVSMGAWWRWSEIPSLGKRMQALKDMFVDPQWDEFMEAVPVQDFDEALVELWSAIRFPPGDQGNG